MTSLDAYIDMIGKTVIEYCNRQRFNNGMSQISLDILDIKKEEGDDTESCLRKIDELKESLLLQIQLSVKAKKSSSQRVNHLLHFLDKYIYFRKALVNSASFNVQGWDAFARHLIKFIDNCRYLYNNESIDVDVPFDKRFFDERKYASQESVGVKLSGLNCLTGFNRTSSGDFGRFLKTNVLSVETDYQLYVAGLIDTHRVLQEISGNQARDKITESLSEQVRLHQISIDALSLQNKSLEKNNGDLTKEVSELKALIQSMSEKLTIVEESQKTLTVMNRPSFFNPPKEKQAPPQRDEMTASL